jgi:hypothetical protein
METNVCNTFELILTGHLSTCPKIWQNFIGKNEYRLQNFHGKERRDFIQKILKIEHNAKKYKNNEGTEFSTGGVIFETEEDFLIFKLKYF